MRTIELDSSINLETLPDRIWNRTFIGIFFTSMTLNLGQYMSNALLAKYADSMGTQASLIGMLMSMFAITAMALKIVSGPAMDTFNKKHMLMAAMAVYSVAYFGFSISSNVSSLMVFRLLQGGGNAFGNVCALTLVAGALPREKYGTGMGYFSLAQVTSQAVGPALGLFVVDFVGFKTTYTIIACIMLLSAVVASTIRFEYRKTKSFRLDPRNIIAKEAILPASITMLMSMGFMTIGSFLVVSSAKAGISANVGLFFTVYAVTLLMTRPFVGKLVDRFGLIRIAIPAILVSGVSFVLISVAANLWVLMAAAVINACGYGAVQPSLQALTMKAVPKERRGAGSSTNYLGQDFGTLLGPALAGVLAQTIGYSSMWRLMTIPFGLCVVLVVVFRKRITAIEENFAITQAK